MLFQVAQQRLQRRSIRGEPSADTAVRVSALERKHCRGNNCEPTSEDQERCSWSSDALLVLCHFPLRQIDPTDSPKIIPVLDKSEP